MSVFDVPMDSLHRTWTGTNKRGFKCPAGTPGDTAGKQVKEPGRRSFRARECKVRGKAISMNMRVPRKSFMFQS